MTTRAGRTKYTEQEILNHGLDFENVKPPTSMRAGLSFVEGLGWVRNPVTGTFAQEQYEWNADGTLGYKGVNSERAAADGNTEWVIFKYTYDGSKRVIKIEMRVTTWTARAEDW